MERTQTKEIETISSDKIELEAYAQVLHVGETYQIPIRAIPEGYLMSELCYSSSDDTVAAADSGTVLAKKPGNARIRIQTPDEAFDAFINILVSEG